MKSIGGAIACVALALASSVAGAATDITHHAIPYFVPEKRIQLEANVTDPRGIKLARTYFKVGAQADYLLVPMQSAGGNRYTALLPAPAGTADRIEYLFLAVNGDGQVARTEAYNVTVKKQDEAPSWQRAGSDGQIKLYTEVAEAPRSTAMFSDSVSMDVVESGARFGAVAGLYGQGTASSAAATTSGTTSTASATAAGIGGLSTAAIVGGVALAGVAAAAAGGGGGGGGGGATSGSAFAGNWSGTQSIAFGFTCPSAPSNNGTCSVSIPFSGSVNASGTFNGTAGAGSVSCTSPSFGSIAQALAGGGGVVFNLNSSGTATLPASNTSQSGVTVNCAAGSVQFSNSPRRITGSQSCSGVFPGPPSCNFNFTTTITGS